MWLCGLVCRECCKVINHMHDVLGVYLHMESTKQLHNHVNNMMSQCARIWIRPTIYHG